MIPTPTDWPRIPTGIGSRERPITDMFDVESEDRIYTVESRTEFAETTSEIIISEARELAKRLRKDDMIR